MLRVDVVSVMPSYFESPLSNGMIRIAREKKSVSIHVHNLHDYGLGAYTQVDDTPYGGGAGMILRPEPIIDCIEQLKAVRAYDEVIYLCPDGEKFDQKTANKLSLKKNIILLCGHYKGIDERVRELVVTKEMSIGDYVLSGGELPALCLIDAVARLIPGVLGDSESALTDSFQEGVLDCAYYTKPSSYRGIDVPEVLRSGNHKAIMKWREDNAKERTEKRRPDMLK